MGIRQEIKNVCSIYFMIIVIVDCQYGVFHI